MKLFAVALVFAVATSAIAQTAPAPSAPAAAPLTIDSSIEALAADPKTKAVIEADFPGMLQHPAYEQFKGMTLKALQPMSNGKITDEQLAKATADLAAVK